MPECVFCDIVANEEPAQRVYEGDATLAFLDTAPATEGHVIVVPKSHRATLTDVEPELVGDVFRTVSHVATSLQAALDPDGLTVHQSNGAAAGQEIDHVHVHVIPRDDVDDVTVQWPHGDPGEEGLNRVATAIREET
ncbi:MAG: HIT family protein [Halopenitus sp.]